MGAGDTLEKRKSWRRSRESYLRGKNRENRGSTSFQTVAKIER